MSGFEWRGRRCLITGAGGFLGSALTRELARLGAEVHASGRVRPERDAPTVWHTCDVGDAARVHELFAAVRPQTVFHLASKVTGGRAQNLVLPTLSANLLGAVHTLLAAAECGCERYVTLGSLQEPDQELPGVPSSPYAAAKFAAGAYVRMFARIYGVSAAIGRPFMAYGPGQTDMTKVVPHILSHILRGKIAELSSGRSSFDWVFVDDVVDALVALAVSGVSDGRTVDIGRGELTSVRDIATGLARRADVPEALKFGAIEDRKLEPTRVADVGETERLIGWRARISLEEGLDRTVAWYRQYFA